MASAATPSSPPADTDSPPAPAAAAWGGQAPAFSPLYQQIKGLILQGLQQGEWKPGEVIPSEFDLAARYLPARLRITQANGDVADQQLKSLPEGR